MKSAYLRAASLTVVGACMFTAASAVTAHARPAVDAPVAIPPSPHYGAWGFDATGRDLKARPGDDFFAFSNGGWIARTVIPADKSSYGAFDTLFDLSEAQVHGILEVAAHAKPAATPQQAQIGALYTAYMDEAAIEAKGPAPLKPDLDVVRAVTSRDAMAALMGRAEKGYAASIFDLDIQPDAKDPTHYSVQLGQSGLGLPDRDYYLEAPFAEKKTAYQAYVAKMLTLAGWPAAAARAAEIVAFETKIAQASWTRAEQRDPEKVYNLTSVADLIVTAPGFAWRPYLAEADLGAATTVVVSTKTSIPRIAAIYAATPLDTLKAWQAFHIVDNAGGLLSSPFVQARFAFRSKTLNGQPELAVRWKRGVRNVNNALGDPVGEVYAARYFPPASKAKMEALIGDLKAAFQRHIEALDWMGPATKTEALKKLANYDVQIGYPKKWRDYSKLDVRADDLYGDIARSHAFEWAYKVERLNKPVDKDEWDMSPQTVNAYNNPVFNEVVFPAAILQAPFFDPQADAAINYGAIGGVIGHEMTHGFDDEGRKFDSHGRLRDWWTAQDAARFEAKSKVLGAQYSAIEPLPGAHIKGELTMGENIADLGGLTLGLDAYHHSLGGKPAPVIDGLTGDQRVFLGWAQVWREKERDDALKSQLVSDPHSPPVARVNAVMRNVEGWYPAWNVKPGDKLYLSPQDRVRIW